MSRFARVTLDAAFVALSAPQTLGSCGSKRGRVFAHASPSFERDRRSGVAEPLSALSITEATTFL